MKKILSVTICIAIMICTLVGCTANDEHLNNLYEEENILPSLEIKSTFEALNDSYKKPGDTNPISAIQFCADPTSVEYNGRIYVYGTNDHQQYMNTSKDVGNSYEYIRSLVVFSTEDMVNWTYHGEIPVGEIAPWIYNSWAPSIVSRVEDDGLTHFYLYFSNSGNGVGVITSTDPVIGWTDPLGKPLVYQGMPDLENCPAPFDPGVCIDDNGVGWLAFGGGVPADAGIHSNVPKIVRLGEDMLSFDSEFVSIDAPLFFEASELNYINGTYVYTFNNNWAPRDGWDYDTAKPNTCSMAYMTSKTPLDSNSWEYRGHYFLNAGETAGLAWSNNHTHLQKFESKWYVFHHTNAVCDLRGYKGGFRSIGVEELTVNEETLEFDIIQPTLKGPDQLKPLKAFDIHPGSEMNTCLEMRFVNTPDSSINRVSVISDDDGAWTMLKGVEFTVSPSSWLATVSGTGTIEVRLDDVNSPAVAAIRFENAESQTIQSGLIEGIVAGERDVYLVFSHSGIILEGWQFR